MATGVPARWVIVCAVLATARPSRAQPPPDRPPVTSATAPAPSATPPAAQPTVDLAAKRRPVAVVVLTPGPAAEQLADQLNTALVNHLDLIVLSKLDLVRTLKGPVSDEDAPALAAARTAKQECEEFLVDLDYPNVDRAARSGIDALLNAQLTSDVLGLYAELAFDAGQAALKQRKPNDASLLFALSYRLDPGKRPDPGRYEPDVVEAYQLATTKTPVPAKLEVKGAGTVWIDGVDRGPPGTFDVSSGLHVVQLAGDDRETRGVEIAVPQTSAVEIEAAPLTDERKVERARAALARTNDPASRASAMKKLAALVGVGDAVLIETGENDALVVQTWRDRESGFSRKVVHDKESPVDLLTPLAPPRPRTRPPEVIPPLPPPPPETPWYRTRWAKGGAVAIAVGALVTGYVLATQTRYISGFGNGNTQEAP